MIHNSRFVHLDTTILRIFFFKVSRAAKKFARVPKMIWTVIAMLPLSLYTYKDLLTNHIDYIHLLKTNEDVSWPHSSIQLCKHSSCNSKFLSKKSKELNFLGPGKEMKGVCPGNFPKIKITTLCSSALRPKLCLAPLYLAWWSEWSIMACDIMR